MARKQRNVRFEEADDDRLQAYADRVGLTVSALVRVASIEYLDNHERGSARMLYTTWGSVRGCCGHAHETQEAAERCIDRDQAGCASQGGYSDREVRIIESRKDLEDYDVTEGPGKPVESDFE